MEGGVVIVIVIVVQGEEFGGGVAGAVAGDGGDGGGGGGSDEMECEISPMVLMAEVVEDFEREGDGFGLGLVLGEERGECRRGGMG